MEEEDVKFCDNCKRDIPSVNFVIHKVHCVRNIRVCPVCKEPVPLSELEEHHEKLHKLLPCGMCGERVCGTDLEDHVRDSCGHTIRSCRFCELELPRRKLPAHETYCGVRTEQCADCGEWVMIKYRQLHLDSNHGFLRLDDDPDPAAVQKRTQNLPKTTNIKPSNIAGSSTNGASSSNSTDKKLPKVDNNNAQNPASDESIIREILQSFVNVEQSRSPKIQNGDQVNGQQRRAIDRGQGDAVASGSRNKKHGAQSRGAIKKRPAPPPPNRDNMSYYRAIERAEREEKERQEQTAYNLARGLPPVLSPAAKLEKLRKMDALQHGRELDEYYKNVLQGRVWQSPERSSIGHVLGTTADRHNLTRHIEPSIRTNGESSRSIQTNGECSRTSQDSTNEGEVIGVSREELSRLKPMTPEEFMERFKQMTCGGGERRGGDRFSEIKSSLRELRRGLNEVTAPYNSNPPSATITSNSQPQSERRSPLPSDSPNVELPCEFCDTLVPASRLVLHQTGCRPELVQRPRRRKAAAQAQSPPPFPADPYENPVIPCEFCTNSLPVYLIAEHQDQCRRMQDSMQYPD